MTEASPTDQVYLRVDEGTDIESVVLAFRKDGELYELAELSPGVEASLEKF